MSRARMHQLEDPPRNESVVDEEVFLDPERRVTALEIAGPVGGHTMPQRQVLRTRGCADRVGLNEAQPLDRRA